MGGLRYSPGGGGGGGHYADRASRTCDRLKFEVLRKSLRRPVEGGWVSQVLPKGQRRPCGGKIAGFSHESWKNVGK